MASESQLSAPPTHLISTSPAQTSPSSELPILRPLGNFLPNQATQNAQDQQRRLSLVLAAIQGGDPLDAELEVQQNRKWKRIFTLHICYTPPTFFGEIMPDILEGKLSNFVYTARIKSVNQLLAAQRNIRDVSHVWRNSITLVMLAATIVTMAVLREPAFPIYFGALLVLFTVWAFVQAWAAMEPKYEREITKLCKSWTQEDTHLHLAYLSRRSTAPRPVNVLVALKTSFTPQQTEWSLQIYESVPIFPIRQFGTHADDGSAWTAATIDSIVERALPLYVPRWDATPAPEYCTQSREMRQVVGSSETLGDESSDVRNEDEDQLRRRSEGTVTLVPGTLTRP
ncbi:hypothetical protein BCR33DRAFT_857844 [Rhizoclosmatium globosum]|uniref:Uncharacterized protein n=1 Tax=Rhizoclosmatium globosum TaxID=329046 RepID=A0A1Y2B2X7_9FUNG|nr:hypothetical protein BCR33DRAFT_857844 [Rhizoclosmatium globosum]|eukprot:ORY29086.1 hypothetical protein BCR33DRAFT_857844 [Rhizoclosmatium globosum]